MKDKIDAIYGQLVGLALKVYMTKLFRFRTSETLRGGLRETFAIKKHASFAGLDGSSDGAYLAGGGEGLLVVSRPPLAG